MARSHHPRSLKYLRKLGYFAEVVEKKVPYTFVSQDLFDWIDIIATNGQEILGVQVTTDAGRRSHRRKAEKLPALRAWIRAGGKLVLHSWAKKRTQLASGAWGMARWRVQVFQYTLEDLNVERPQLS